MTVAPLTPADLTMVILVRDDDDPVTSRPLPTLPVKEVGPAVADLAGKGIRSVKLFAGSDVRDARGSHGSAADSVMARAIQEAKAADDSVTVMTETCLCSYTTTGECYIADRLGKPDPSATIEAMAAQAVAQADAGADVVGPAAMLAGSVARVRQALDATGHHEVAVMPHLIFDSRLYDGYRQTMDAVPTSGDRRPFQIDPRSPAAAVRAALEFIGEGAGMLLLEPALFCADILITLRQICEVPLSPFSVSGEYQRLATAADDWRLLLELFTALKRAGSSRIITYAANDMARILA